MTTPYHLPFKAVLLSLLITFTVESVLADQEKKPATTGQAKPADTSTLKLPAALEAAGYRKFAAAVEAAGLKEALEADGPYTCFAPTDKAFDAMPDETKKLLTENPKSENAQLWIKYHVIKTSVKRSDLMKMGVVFGLAEKPIRIWVTPEQISINSVCEITRFDIAANNGTIHEVQRVLNSADR